MITNKVGDLLVEVQADLYTPKFIFHGTNCQGKYKSGFAGQIRRVYPSAYDAYLQEYNNGGLTLGQSTVWGDEDFLIINANTQEFYGRDENIVYVSYSAVRDCCKDIAARAGDYPGVEVHFPLIGCGLANGDWDIISKIIDEELGHLKLFLWTLPEAAPNLNPDFFAFPE